MITWSKRRADTGGYKRKRPTLGDKVDLFQEKGDKSITLSFYNAIGMPFFFFIVFFKKTQHRSGADSFPDFIHPNARVQFFVLLAHHLLPFSGTNNIYPMRTVN
jgi:hypothetical protein